MHININKPFFRNIIGVQLKNIDHNLLKTVLTNYYQN